MIILAIESSCDETAVAITKDGELLANVISSQVDVHKKYGGVMPEVASRLHAENIGVCLKEALERANLSFEDVDYLAVTEGPGLVGCLHVGVTAAKTLSLIYDKPLIPVHHLAGHIYACEYVGELKFPLLAVVVSGGNTELVYMEKHLSYKIVGETKDDAVGECYDKVARVLGLPYPGGLPIDQRAREGKPTYKLPIPHREKGTYDFSYSGLKTAVINLVHNLEQKGEEVNVNHMCASFQEVAIKMVVDRTLAAARDLGVKQIVLAGGVSANSYLRERVVEELKNFSIEVLIPPLWCTTDNAAMIAKVAEHLIKEGVRGELSLSPDPNLRLAE